MERLYNDSLDDKMPVADVALSQVLVEFEELITAWDQFLEAIMVQSGVQSLVVEAS